MLVAGSVVQNLTGFHEAQTLEGMTQLIPGGQGASPEAIKELGTYGGGILNANSAHPNENPNPITNFDRPGPGVGRCTGTQAGGDASGHSSTHCRA